MLLPSHIADHSLSVLPMLSDPPASPAVAIARIWLLLFLILIFLLFAVSVIDHSLRSNSCSHHLPLLCHDCLSVACYCWSPPDDCWFLLLRLLSMLAVPVPSPEPPLLLLLQLTLLPAHRCHLLLLVVIATSWLLLFPVAVGYTTCCAGAEATDISHSVTACYTCTVAKSHRCFYSNSSAVPQPLLLPVDCWFATKRSIITTGWLLILSPLQRYWLAVTITITAGCTGTIAIVCCCSFHRFSLRCTTLKPLIFLQLSSPPDDCCFCCLLHQKYIVRQLQSPLATTIVTTVDCCLFNNKILILVAITVCITTHCSITKATAVSPTNVATS